MASASRSFSAISSSSCARRIWCACSSSLAICGATSASRSARVMAVPPTVATGSARPAQAPGPAPRRAIGLAWIARPHATDDSQTAATRRGPRESHGAATPGIAHDAGLWIPVARRWSGRVRLGRVGRLTRPNLAAYHRSRCLPLVARVVAGALASACQPSCRRPDARSPVHGRPRSRQRRRPAISTPPRTHYPRWALRSSRAGRTPTASPTATSSSPTAPSWSSSPRRHRPTT